MGKYLRFVLTKKRETTASQLLKRLTSYPKQHKTYLALREFGRIIKTKFLLEYIDDVTLRQQIEKQLNKIENANKFSKAIYLEIMENTCMLQRRARYSK